MNLVVAKYDEDKNTYIYDINPGFPPNCKVCNYDSFTQIDLKSQLMLFIGAIYDGNSMGIANSLAEVSLIYPEVTFCFKFIFDEIELEKVAPKEVGHPMLPIILCVNNGLLSVVSNGLIHKNVLNAKIAALFREA